jgi:uncharacterized damage-inducible protein DinB
VMGLPCEAYRARVVRTSGTIGQHVRHILDHVSALVAAHPGAVLSYDHRCRGTAVETNPDSAVREIFRLETALDRWSMRLLDQPVSVTSMIAASGQSVTGWSTLARELAFVVNHTIHHQAMIAVLLEVQGIVLEQDRFGYSPSTPTQQ